MYELQVYVKSKNGIHARPSAMIVDYVRCHRSKVTIENPRNKKLADAGSIMSMLCLDTYCGELVIIKGYGEDEKEVVEHVAQIVKEFDI